MTWELVLLAYPADFLRPIALSSRISEVCREAIRGSLLREYPRRLTIRIGDAWPLPTSVGINDLSA